MAALDPSQSIEQLNHTSWTAKDGLTGAVSALAQTTDGFLWIGTTGGLLRFDGVTFERYKPETGSFPSSDVTALSAPPNGGLWIGYSFGGVSFLKDGHVTNYTERDGLRIGYVRNLIQDLDGTVWAALMGGLARFDGRRWEYIHKTWNFPSDSPSSLAIDHRGTVWACALHEGVFSLLKGQRKFQQVRPGPISGQAPTFAETSDGTTWLWIPHTSTLLRLGRTARPVSQPIAWPQGSGGALLIDRDGGAWMATEQNGIRRIPFPLSMPGSRIVDVGPLWQRYSRREGLTDVDANSFLEDREGNVWVGTVGGLDRFRNRNLSWTDLQPYGNGFTLVAGIKGEVWAGSANALVDIRSSGRVRGGPTWGNFAYRDRDGSIWLWGGKGDSVGLWHAYDGKFVRVTLPYKAPVRAMARDGNGNLWISIRGSGVFRLSHNVWKLVEILKGSPDLTAYSALSDANGRVWLSYPERKLISLWDNGRTRLFSASSGLTIGAVNVLAERDRQVWVGGELGLAYFKDGRFHTVGTVDGGFGSISGIIPTPDGLWLSNGTGILLVSRNEVQSVLRNPSYHVRYESFDLVSDLPQPVQNSGSRTVAVQASNGILWFATTSGVARIDPTHIFRNSLAPLVSVRSIFANGKTYSASPSVTLPPYTRNVRIDFAALSLSIPERVRSRHKLDGADSDWQDAGSLREAFYNNLGPGKYTFHVVACNNDGVWNQVGASATFSIQPAVYQTAWFQFLYVAAGASSIWLLYRLRLRQATDRVQLRYTERLAERTRIARELHDTLLQSLAGVSLQLSGISKQVVTSPETTIPLIDHVRGQVDACFREARTKVWNLRSPALESGGLAQVLREISGRIGTSASSRCDFSLVGQSRPCPPAVEEELMGIAQEAINNAIRHAQSSEIQLVLEYEERLLTLSVFDNGCGFDLEGDSRKSGHWGLKNMQERAAEVGGKFKITTALGRGTRIEVRVPLKS